ncbi:cyanoexosortase B system-associated protein [Aphanothece sacrum]|nr:cyanoexosortase B system-associated protein [Aphanothece sacrum]
MNKLKYRVNLSRVGLKMTKGILPSQIIILCLLTLAITIAAVPGYLSGKWTWKDQPQVTQIKEIASIRKTSLPLEGWKTLTQKEIVIGGNQWSMQIIEKPEQDPVTLLLMPQDYYKNHPQVEWVDIQGLEKWKTDSHTTLKFKTGEKENNEVTAHFFKGWNNQTFAVVQWYAWPNGGNFAPAQWFWVDQKAQLKRQRVPWVGVSVKIPIEPLSELKDVEPLAKSLAQTIQATLDKNIFQR